MTREEFAAALSDATFALRYRADRLSDLSGGSTAAANVARKYRAHADLLDGTDVRGVPLEVWKPFEHAARARARTLPPPSMLEPS